VVRRAALDELADAGYGGFTIESVAARAGVAKSTIYRHWSDKLALVADAFESSHEEMVPDTATGTARDRIVSLLRHVAEVVVDSTFSRCIPALIEGAVRDRRLREFQHRYSTERRGGLVAGIDDGIAAGEFSHQIDPDLAAQLLLGVIFYRRLMTDEPFDPAGADNLVDTVLGPAPRRQRASRR
jgi:TetR/AcrR family transcriptional regulator of autoinduction and epiphytic fitness